MFRKFISLNLVALMLSSCATIFSKTKQEVTVSAGNNDNVVATISGIKYTLPAKVKLKRGGENIQILESDNPSYQTSNVNSASLSSMGVNPIYWVNIVGIFVFILPGVIASIVDVSTGAAHQYNNENLVVPVYKK